MLSVLFWFCTGSVLVLLNALFRRMAKLAVLTLKQARRIAILILGVSVILVGVAMLFLPGPGLVVIPAGLAILAIEFVWARRILSGIKNQARSLVEAVTGEGADPPENEKKPQPPASTDAAPPNEIP